MCHVLERDEKLRGKKIFSEAKGSGGRCGNRHAVSAAIPSSTLPPVRAGTGEVEEGECPSDEPLHCSSRRGGFSSGSGGVRRVLPRIPRQEPTSTSLAVRCLSDPSCLAPAWSCSHSTEAALRQAETISKLLLCALLPSAMPAAAGAL